MSTDAAPRSRDSRSSPTQGEVVLEVRDVKKHFPLTQGIVFQRTIGHVKAVDGVSFQLHKGETLGVVGESGCGKSTLGRLLMGLETPDRGLDQAARAARWPALKPARCGALRRDIQIVLQDPYSSLDPRMTVGDIVGEPFDLHPDALEGRGAPHRGRRSCSTWSGLNPDHINRYPHQFSGGQRQRIGIARALTLRPKILVCDEPVSALDVSVQAQVVNLFERLQDEFGLSYVFIAHDLSVVRHISDRVMVMYLGKAVEIGDEDEIYGTPTHPYTQALLSAVPVPDPRIRGPARPHRPRRATSRARPTRRRGAGSAPGAGRPRTSAPRRSRCSRSATQSDHLSACHFAAPRDVIHAIDEGQAP